MTDLGARRDRVERAVADLIRALELEGRVDPEIARTPGRVADLYAEIFTGLDPAASPDLATFPHAGGDDLVVVRGIRFHSLCVHHFVPFFGTAVVAYLPSDRIIGISGPARLVDHYSRRPQLQEQMTRDIADHLERLLAPRGLAVIVNARHLCMEMRGIRSHGRVETRTVRGQLNDAPWQGALASSR